MNEAMQQALDKMIENMDQYVDDFAITLKQQQEDLIKFYDTDFENLLTLLQQYTNTNGMIDDISLSYETCDLCNVLSCDDLWNIYDCIKNIIKIPVHEVNSEWSSTVMYHESMLFRCISGQGTILQVSYVGPDYIHDLGPVDYEIYQTNGDIRGVYHNGQLISTDINDITDLLKLFGIFSSITEVPVDHTLTDNI